MGAVAGLIGTGRPAASMLVDRLAMLRAQEVSQGGGNGAPNPRAMVAMLAAPSPPICQKLLLAPVPLPMSHCTPPLALMCVNTAPLLSVSPL